jgi:hypothetical protein
MKVAKIINNSIYIQSIFVMFPNVSFPDVGVPDVFLQTHNLYKVIEFIPHNPETQIFNLLDEPVLKDNIVYTGEVLNKTDEVIKSGKLIKIKQYRNELLNESDNYVTIDRWESYSDEQKTAWRQYRQSLRDIPQSANNPDNIVWPIKPN